MTDSELEHAIDEVGRDLVFARARALGWSSGDAVPKFVWRGIVDDLRAGRQSYAAEPPRRLDEAILGFRLL